MPKRLFLVSLCLLPLLAACSNSNLPAEVVFNRPISPYHTVQPGESIASIAQKYDMDRMDVVRLNGITPPYHIVVGQRLLVNTTSAQLTQHASEGNFVESQAQSGVTVTPLPATNTPTEQEGVPMHSSPLAQAMRPGATTDVEPHHGHTEVPVAESHFVWPVKGKVIRAYDPGHGGINIKAPKGTPVLAVNNGVVVHTGNKLRGFGNIILVRHDNGFNSVYAHLDNVRIKNGDIVYTGQRIGSVGKTGNVREPQLHFELRKGRVPVDPTDYLIAE